MNLTPATLAEGHRRYANRDADRNALSRWMHIHAEALLAAAAEQAAMATGTVVLTEEECEVIVHQQVPQTLGRIRMEEFLRLGRGVARAQHARDEVGAARLRRYLDRINENPGEARRIYAEYLAAAASPDAEAVKHG